MFCSLGFNVFFIKFMRVVFENFFIICLECLVRFSCFVSEINTMSDDIPVSAIMYFPFITFISYVFSCTIVQDWYGYLSRCCLPLCTGEMSFYYHVCVCMHVSIYVLCTISLPRYILPITTVFISFNRLGFSRGQASRSITAHKPSDISSMGNYTIKCLSCLFYSSRPRTASAVLPR